MDKAGSAIPDTIMSGVRGVFYAVSGSFVTKGAITGDQQDLIFAAIAAVAGLVWSFRANRGKKAKLQAAIEAPAGRAE